MANTITPLDACRTDLFASADELRQKYPLPIAERVMRIREVYNWWLAEPSMYDRQLRDRIMEHFHVSQSTAYSDIAIVHQLVPLLSEHSREYHRARANEMLLETYAIAKEKKDTKAMERVIATMAKINRLDKPDEYSPEYDQVPVQSFFPSNDPRVLGIEPIPDIYNVISRLTKELSRDNRDILDVDFEEPDLEEAHLFAPIADVSGQP